MHERSVPEVLRGLATRDPAGIAIDTGDEQLSYAELEARTRQLAGAIAGRQPGARTPIAVFVDHGLEPIIGILGVLHAGHIAMPIDVREPADRVASILRTSGAQLLVTAAPHEAHSRVVAAGLDVLVSEHVADHSPPNGDIQIDDGTPGLLVFTSGTTGAPKGVLDSHCGAIARARMFGARQYAIEHDRVGLTSSFTFAATHTRMFEALVNHATVCPYDLRQRGLRSMPAWVARREITTVFLVPSQLRALANAAPAPRMESLRLVVLAGEALFGRDVQRARDHFGPDTIFLNRLGATEANVINGCVLDLDTAGDTPVPVGSSDDDVELRVVDPESGAPVRAGERGRLVIVAHHLPLGYWNDPEATAAAYATEPDDRRAFRSGDLVRTRPDGALEYLGRLDGRVKIRGAMVALTEVEGALLADDDLSDAVVVGAPTGDGGTRLVAYIVPAAGRVPRVWQVRRQVAQRLPSTMVPTVIVVLDALPRNDRGKVDRATLPAPLVASTHVPRREPVGGERVVVNIMRDVLALDELGVDDDFFELGGDSLGAIELLVAIEEQLRVRLSESILLEAPTAARLAARIDDRNAGPEATVAVQFRADRTDDAAPGDAFTGAPVFFVGGAGASTLLLRPLADAMAPRPFYGFQQRGLETRGRPHRSVEAAARSYLTEVRSIQPRGPYRLGGYSLGGLIAFDMACRLTAAGDTVELLAIVDTPAPGARTKIVAKKPMTSGRARASARSVKLRVRGVLATIRTGIRLRTGSTQRSRIERHAVFFAIGVRQGGRYRPTAKFPGPVLVIRADHRARHDNGGDDLGWSRWVTGPITAVGFPVDHDGVVRPPVVADLGALIRDS